MVEPIMYLAIGFLVSMLLSLMIMPLVHNRAVRLTTRRLEAQAPLSIAEIQADKDHMRADFAMSARRLELNIDRLRHKTITQAADLGRKTETIHRLQVELEAHAATIADATLRETDLTDRLTAADAAIVELTATVQSHEASLADRQAEAARLSHDLSTTEQTAGERLTNLTAAKAEAEGLTARLNQTTAELVEAQSTLTRLNAERDELNSELATSRSMVTTQSKRIADLDHQLTSQVTAADSLTTKLRALDGDDHGQAFTELEFENKQLKQQIDASDRLVRELRVQVADTAKASESPAAPGADEKGKDDNAVLREKINDIAADVARLALNLEGNDSTIGAILTAQGASTDSGAGKGKRGRRQTLAERIKALPPQPGGIKSTG